MKCPECDVEIYRRTGICFDHQFRCPKCRRVFELEFVTIGLMEVAQNPVERRVAGVEHGDDNA